MSEPLQHWQQLPCVAFLDWLEQHLRRQVMYSFEARPEHATRSAIDLNEAWQSIMLTIYTEDRVGADWQDRGHLHSWIMGQMSRRLWTIQRDWNRRRWHKSGQMYSCMMNVSELEHERYSSLMADLARAPKPREKPDLGPSTGWLTTCIESLTPKRREAIELMIVGDFTREQAAAYTGTRPGTMKDRKKDAVAQLRDWVTTGEIKNTMGRVVATQTA